MHSNRWQLTSGLAHYYMETDSLILVNTALSLDLFLTRPPGASRLKHVPFSNYQTIYEILYTHKKPITTDTKILKIYDITHVSEKPLDTIFPVNDHINRIGNNPFIGQQKFFNIDFINVEQIYVPDPKGVTTTSYGGRYEQHKTHKNFPSTHIANIATLAHIQSYIVEGYLINQL